MEKILEDNKKFLDVYEQKFVDMNNTITEQKTKCENMENTLKNVTSRLDDLNIAELFGNSNIDMSNDCKIAVALISDLDKKLTKKIKFSEERLTKLEDESYKQKAEMENIKNYQENLNKNVLPSIKEDIKQLSKSKDEILEKTINIEKMNENLMESIEEHKNEIKENHDELITKNNELKQYIDNIIKEIDKNPHNEVISDDQNDTDKYNENKDILKRLTDIEKNFKVFQTTADIESMNNDLKNIKEQLKTICTLEMYQEHVSQLNEHNKQINLLKDQVDTIIEDQTFHDEIAAIKRKLDNIQFKVDNLEAAQSNCSNNVQQKYIPIDTNKFVDINSYKNYQKQIENNFRDSNHNYENINKLVNNILNTLKSKGTKQDLKTLEDDIMGKIEDLKNTSSKKFADKNETTKNYKYLDQQIKHIIEVYIKKMDTGENWLLAKKPLGGNICASCDNYLGELKDNTKYVQWNKYPNRDNNDRVYRIGNGFSKMLQLINVEGLNGNLNDTNYNQGFDFENSKTMSHLHKQHFDKKVLPKLDNKKNNPTVPNDTLFDDIDNYKDDDDNKPKM